MIWKTEGPRGLFSYFHVALLRYIFDLIFLILLTLFYRDMPFSIAYFSSYEVMKELMRIYNVKRGRQGDKLNVVQNLIAGGVAGMVSTTITIPIDVVKTRYSNNNIIRKKKEPLN